MLVKAAFGGGGRGMHVVRKPEELEYALTRAAREAQAYFGRPEVLLERYIDQGHHVEAQVIADARGNVFFLGERDCSVQRRHQKLIEESPSPVVDAELRSRIGEAAMALAKEAGYLGAGTVECIVDEDGNFYFLEMNTRLQVEHTVTEMVTGLDLVAMQIQVALGEKLDLSDVRPVGHAIQCRINAEDPAQLPARPGSDHRVPRRRGRSSGWTPRCDRARRSSDYDSMFAKLIVSAENRGRAISRMDRALGEYHVEGVPTTIPLHRWILGTRAFRKATHSTTWLEKALRDAELPDGGIDAARGGREGARAGRAPARGRRAEGPRADLRPPARDGAAGSSAPDRAHGGEHVHSVIAAPMQGTILRVLVEPGQEIQAGDVVCILEAMKMENAIPAPARAS